VAAHHDKPRRVRVNMRIPADLLVWAKSYAISKNKNVTQIVVDHFTGLKEKANGNGKTHQSR
jgi:hypothetical protein